MTETNSINNHSHPDNSNTVAVLQTEPTLNGIDPHSGALKTGMHRRTWWGLILVGWLAMLVFTFHACTRMVAAGDTWVAMACGRHFANHGVDTNEPFSANSHHEGPTEEEVAKWPGWARWITDTVGLDTVKKWHPTGWVNQNWLTHLIFYKLTTGLGSEEKPYYDALVYWKVGLYILTAIFAYAIARLLGAHPALAATAACFALYTGRTFLDVRPAGFSNFLVPVMLLILVLATYRHHLFIWLLIPMTVFWGNLHGGYIYVFIVLIPFVGLHLMTGLPKRWTSWLYSTLGWFALYILVLKLMKHPQLTDPILGTKYVVLLAILGLVGLGMTWAASVQERHVHMYHGVTSLLVFALLFFGGMLPTIHYRITGRSLDALRNHLASARLGFFALFVLFMILGAVLVFAKRSLVTLRLRSVLHMIGAYTATFIAAVIFNPFHLTNLTHTFIISVSEHAKRWRDVHEWHPAFDWSNPVGTAKPFLVLYILSLLTVITWLVVRIVTRKVATPASSSDATEIDKPYRCPQIDLPLLIVGALTVYMAIRSRRFIPIAALAACPLLAMLIQQIIDALSSVVQFKQTGKRFVPRLPLIYQQGIAGAGLIFVLFWGCVWGIKIKHIYLDAWPVDPEFHSVFMRMTASYLKPFHACRFLRMNKIEGNMLNYWTEGGAIAFGQEPDACNGRTPLQLFMDGRAQAAYDVKTFNTWSLLWAGGKQGYALRQKGNKATMEEWKAVGRWLDTQLKKRKVWVSLIPFKEWNSQFGRALDYAPNWRVVFLNNKQKMYVDIDDPRAQKLVQGILSGDTKYPREFDREATLAHYFMLYGRNRQERRKGFDHAVRAFELNPSGVPANIIFEWSKRQPDLVPAIKTLADEFLEDFETQRDTYRESHGYRYRLDAAHRAALFLHDYSNRRKQPEAVTKYKDLIDDIGADFRWIGSAKRW